MAEPILIQDGRIVTDNGRIVLGRCGKCCGQCAFYRYLPCVSDPHPECPYPEPAYVSTCWQCTTAGTATTVIDDQGYCWGRESDQKYLPRDGATGDPPEGFEWIPDGAVVWTDTEGPCATDCAASVCRTFDRFLPARKCNCSTGPGPETMYFRCSEISGMTGCVVGRSPGGLDCYELDRQAPSVPGPISPGLIITNPTHDSCCSCCDGLAGSPCESEPMTIRRGDGCPVVVGNQQAPTCCEDDSVFQIGYSLVLESFPGQVCPPNRLEHWWFRDQIGGWRRYRYEEYDSACVQEVRTGEDPRTSISCNTALVWDMLTSWPSPPSRVGLGSNCTGTCPGTMRWRETPSAGTFSATTYWPALPGDPCEVAYQVTAAVIRVTTGDACGGNCNSFSPASPVIPPEPGGGDSPAALGFGVRFVQNRNTGLLKPKVTHPALPRIVDSAPSVALATNTRPRGCRNCGSDGGL